MCFFLNKNRLIVTCVLKFGGTKKAYKRISSNELINRLAIYQHD